MGKIFKRTMATVMVVLSVLTSVPLSGFVGMEWDWLHFTIKSSAVEEGLSSVATVQRVGYGVYDTDVVATKVSIGEGYTSTADAYGEGYVIVRNSDYSTYYLVGTKGVVKAFDSDEGRPELTLINEYSADNPYALYRVYNPETQKYDLYNANTCQYYEYALDELYSYAFYSSSIEYAKNTIRIKKDGKYGLVNNKGQMLYSPMYSNIYCYENGFIGYYKDDDNNSCCALLSNKGTTTGREKYDDCLIKDKIIFAVSDVEPGETWDTEDYKDWALVDSNLKLMTGFDYHNVEILQSNGMYYRVCSVRYEEIDIYGDTDSFYQHYIVSNTGSSWNVCEKYNCFTSAVGIYNSTVNICENGLKIYITDNYGYYTRNGTGAVVNPDIIPVYDRKYIIARPDGEAVYYASLTTEESSIEVQEEWGNVEGIYGRCVVRLEYTNKLVYNLYDSKANLVLGDISSNCITEGNYLICKGADKSFIYDYVNEKMILDNIYIPSVDNAEKGICFAETKIGVKWAVFDTETGKYTDYVITLGEDCVVKDCLFTTANRKLWICGNDFAGQYSYVNDKGVVLSTATRLEGKGSIHKSGDYLIKSLNENSYGQVEFIDYDGRVINSYSGMDCKDLGENDAYVTYDSEKRTFGLVSRNGTTVIDSVVSGIGNRYNGLSFVVLGRYAAVVDPFGNALVCGKFETKENDYNDAYKAVGKSGFISLKKDGCIYIYDFTACNGFDENADSSVITEDHLFGEYSAFLNNGFYNSLTDTAGKQVANALSHYGKDAREIAFIKSMLDDQTDFVINEIVDSFPGSSLNEINIKQEMALEYLNALDAETTSKYLEILSTANGIVSKINDAIKLDCNLDSGKSKLEFVEGWTKGTGLYKSDIYKVIDEAKKHQDRFDAYFKITGRTITILEFVNSYLTIYLLQRDMVKSLMDMINPDSDLYEGLNYIYVKQTKAGTVAALVTEMITNEIIDAIVGLIDEGLLKLADAKNANIGTLVLYVGGKIAALTIDSPKLQDIDKAILAYANMVTLKNATKNYQKKIADNYSNNGGISVDTLKSNYSLLGDTYFKSIFAALKYAKEIAYDSEKPVIEKYVDDFERKLIYRSYIKTCLLNARAQWEYTVKANKAVITKLKAVYPSGEGRVAYMDLYNSSYSEKDELKKTAYPFEYAIDIPSTVDGYQVGSVGSASFSENNRVTGVYFPDTVTEIQDSAFKNCNQINTIYLSSSLETIGNNAFENCSDLSVADIPDSVKTIGEETFTGVDDLLITGSDENLLADIASDNVSTLTRDLSAAKIEIVSPATKTQFNMQDEIDTAGLTVRITYTDGSTKDVTEGIYADIVNRVVGENTVVVYYEGLKAEYSVNIIAGNCDYTVLYQDEQGNELAESYTGTATAGSILNLEIPEIAGYNPVNTTQQEVIGYSNIFIVRYTEAAKTSIDSATITVQDQIFAQKNLTPNIEVNLDGLTLAQGQDYTVSYLDNYYVGTALVVVMGAGNYEGMVTADFLITETSHTWMQWQIYYEPYGSRPGVKYRVCDGCGKTEYVSYINEDHVHSYRESITEAATCTSTGVKTYTCPCGDSYTETIAKTGHSYGSYKTIKSATCTVAGSKQRNCSTCGNVEPASIAKLGHNYASSYTTDKKATCVAEGSKSKHCTRSGCTAKTSVTVIAATDHSYGSYKTIKNATCTATGSKQRSCSVCKTVETATIAKLGHNYSSTFTTDKKATCTTEGSKSKHCTRSGCTAKTSVTAIAKLGHKYDNACDTTCNTCKATRSVTHSYKVTTTKATLSKNGKVVNKCSICGYSKTTTVYYPKTITLSATKYTYNGKAKTPTVTVKDSKGKTLKKDTDYTVKYASGRKSTGKYAVTVTFKGKYSGTKTLYFNILPSKTSKITPTCAITSIKVSWSKVTGASGYKVELLNSKGKVVKTVTTTKLTYTFKKLSKVTTYKVKVTAYKTIDKKAVYSTASTTITTSTAPAAVTLSKVTAGSKSATASWKKVSGASGYEVMYSTSSKFSSSKTANVTKGSTVKQTIKKLTKGKKYYFKVRAYRTVDGKKIYGSWSAVKNVKVK